MNNEKSLGDVALEVFYKTDGSASYVFNKVASAVEKEVLSRLNKEPVAGQELTFVQVAQWVEKHGSTKGLEAIHRLVTGSWSKLSEGILNIECKYRVATQKVNDPDDPTTWEKGVIALGRDDCNCVWVIFKFIKYVVSDVYKFKTDKGGSWAYAKLATPEQIAAWELIQSD